ncbi:DegT/DnrJ/EryC1/StrS family aminotransferase [Vibrio cholerae]|uniref:DegT/DnrJ/EryC1/StrS family aminotransferase n=2 Tax=Vibrio cholerae TaxID=666 RepID=UPI001DD89044|nr:DegT/DnrJ/EryC1/StrS family aminotransferase [Vibrio cholerae]BCN16663.1 putative transaminase [Vibrio cholerae]GHW66704.1 UDP-2-acetamido-2-deoxy-ribo-hexuluronate aminotransferase [Vibrio cholerae]
MRNIPLNDTSRISDIIISEVSEDISHIISSGRWLLGEYNSRFSELFATYIGVNYCLPVANGTDALEIALKSCSKPGKNEVITVANAGGYTSAACYLSGLKPIYADVLADSMLMDIHRIDRLVNKKTACIVVTHLYGRAVNVIELRNILSKSGYPNIPIIEDCAQAHGASINGRKVGGLGDIATFSFYPTKNLGTVGDAGAITTNSISLFEYAKQLSQYGWSSKYSIDLRNGRNSRMDEIQAAILCKLLYKLDDWNQRRREIYSRYISSNSNLFFYKELGESNVVHLAILRVKKRDEFLSYMRKNGVMVDIHYPILDCDQIAWCSTEEYIPVSRALVNEIVTLPCFPTMTDNEIEYVCDLLSRWSDD